MIVLFLDKIKELVIRICPPWICPRANNFFLFNKGYRPNSRPHYKVCGNRPGVPGTVLQSTHSPLNVDGSAL